MKKLLFAILFGLALLPVLSVTAPSAQAREVVAVREHRTHRGGSHYSSRHRHQRAYRHRYNRHHYNHRRHRSGSGVSVSIGR